MRWGKDRARSSSAAGGAAASATAPGAPPTSQPAAHLSEEAAALLADLRAKPGPYAIAPADALLSVPGLGAAAGPVVTRAGFARVRRVMGFWSRDAVFARVDLATCGLGAPVSCGRLRVSEELLEGSDTGALYVHKGRPRAPEVLARVERLMTPLAAGARAGGGATTTGRRPKKAPP